MALSVRCITADALGGSPSTWRSTAVNDIWTIDVARFRPGMGGLLNFVFCKGKPVKVAVFAANYEGVERAFIVMTPVTGTASNVLIVITHGFGQNDRYYSGLGYSNPLSPPLIRMVLDTFVLGRWGPQLMAVANDCALVLPVRARGGGHGELGPFVTHPHLGTEVLTEMIMQTDRGFDMNGPIIVTFSSGIYDTNTFIAAGGKGLGIRIACNQDPAGGLPISQSVPIRKQYLSGQTTGGPRPGFEYMPFPRWENEPNRKAMFGHPNDVFNYMHSWCIPMYTLHLALAGP